MILSSLTKVFTDRKPNGKTIEEASFFQNERYSLQAVFYSKEEGSIDLKINCLLPFEVFKVGQVFVSHPETKDRPTEQVEKNEIGLYPDVLYPIENDTYIKADKGWNSIWITVSGKGKAGEYILEVAVDGKTDKCNLAVIPYDLPEQKLIYTNWMHCDCFADWYNIPVFSDEYWDILKEYFLNAVKFGQNMIYVPLFTPPLDTAVGEERLTAQLVDIFKDDDKYSFNFSKVKRWIDLSLECGFMYFEMTHLFSQWGATAAPKIVVETRDGIKKEFGWEILSTSKEYGNFLSQFLPELCQFLRENGLKDKVYFHFSDEPYDENLADYNNARSMATPFIEGYKTMDAVSIFSIYEQRLVDIPVVATTAVKAFLENGETPDWVYYCCSQFKDVCNRFIAMKSYNNRALGFQLYINNTKGFLHWGYNYWYARFSKGVFNPFTGQPADLDNFAAGDGYIVYPGDNKPISSLRQFVFFDALQDMRACELLEKLTSRENVLEILKASGYGVGFEKYPKSDEEIIYLREKVNKEIYKPNYETNAL